MRPAYARPLSMRIERIVPLSFETPPARSSLSPYRTTIPASSAIARRIPSATPGSKTHIVATPVRSATGSGRPWPWLPMAERLSYSSRVSWTQAAGRA